MATQAEINAHDQLISRLADELAAGLESMVSTALLGLSDIDISDRLAIADLFANVKNFTTNQIQGLDVLASSNLSMNAVEPSEQIQDQVVLLKTVSANTMNIAIDEEINTIAGELVAAGILGLGTATILRQILDRLPVIINRLRRAYDQTLIQFTSVLTKTLGGTQFRYTGGLIATSRPFCNTHNNGVYTEAEINRIWTGSWGGKAPGDPFVVRGGYNCRHFFVLES